MAKGSLLGLLLGLLCLHIHCLVSPLRQLFDRITVDSFPSEMVDQWRRSLVASRIPLLQTTTQSLEVVTLPQGSSTPLHSRPGTTTLKTLYGAVNVALMEVSSVEGVPAHLAETYPTSMDAFAGEEDCVCRGGRCPRRHGCSFWVEKQLRDKGAYFVANQRLFSLSRESESLSLSFPQGPKAFYGEGSSALLELFDLDEEMADTNNEYSSQTMLYYTSSALVDRSHRSAPLFKVTSSTTPLGYPPVHVPYRGPSLMSLMEALNLEEAQ